MLRGTAFGPSFVVGASPENLFGVKSMRVRISDFFAIRRSTVGVLAMVCLVGMGERMAERFLPIYLLALGGGPLVIGLLQAMDNLLSALYSFPGGYLSDRIGARRALIVFNLVAMAGFAIVILVPVWQAVIVGAIFFISWTAVSSPATLSLIYGVLPQNRRTMGVTMHSLIRRIPMALGPVLGGLFIMKWGERDGVRLAFVVALVMAGVALFLQQWLIREADTSVTRAIASPEQNPLRLFRRMQPALRHLLISDPLIRFCEQIPYAFVVVWCMKVITHPVTASQFGLLTAIEMATATLIYVPVAYFADRTTKKPFVVLTFAFFTGFPLALLYCHSLKWLVLAFILRGLKEFGEPTRKSLIMDLCPDDCRAGMFGLYYLIRDVVVSLAALGGAFLWQAGPQTNLLTAFAFGVLGTVGFAMIGRSPAAPATPRSQ